MMSIDITFVELDRIKCHICNFLNIISQRNKLNDYQQIDKDFFSFIAKHIVFFRYLYNNDEDTHFYKALISDLYCLILSIIQNNIRYIYLNERSIIENYMRAIMQEKIKDNQVTTLLFKEMNEQLQQIQDVNFTKDDFSKLKNAYRTSCNYIHGGNLLNDNLVFVLEEYDNMSFSLSDRKSFYLQVQTVFKIYDKILIYKQNEYINLCFHRKKSILEYLLGKKYTDFLIDIRDKNAPI